MSSKLLTLLLVASIGCADGATVPLPFVGYLTVWNRNSVSPDNPSFYEILELYVHTTGSSQGAPSLLEQPLAIDATLAVPFVSEQYVPVVRRRNTGQTIALTTGKGLDIDSSCYVLEVFDETFRLQQNSEVALPALVAAGQAADCGVNTNDGGSADGADGGGDPAPGDQ